MGVRSYINLSKLRKLRGTGKGAKRDSADTSLSSLSKFSRLAPQDEMEATGLGDHPRASCDASDNSRGELVSEEGGQNLRDLPFKTSHFSLAIFIH